MSQSTSERTQSISVKRNKGTSLQTRLVLLMLLVASVPLIIIATRDTIQTQQALTNEAEISLKSSALQTANSLDNFIQTTLDSVSAETRFNDFTTYFTPSSSSDPIVQKRVLNLLNNLSNKDSRNIISYALIDVDGNVLLDTVDSNIKNKESAESYFPLVRFSNKPIVSASTYSGDKTPSITFASKITNLNGDYIGILRVKYSGAVFQDVIIKSVGQSDDVSVLLLDPFHVRMADSQNPDLILTTKVPLDVKQSFFRADITPKIPGDDTIAVAFLRALPWTVVYSRPTSIFLADVQNQIRINIILVLITLLFIAIITALIARSLTNPIVALAKTADSISLGDLNARADVDSMDEIGVLASAFNSMADQLQSTLVGLEQRIQARTVELQQSNLQLETISEVAREIATIRDMDTLLRVSVELIRERFAYYHVGIYFMDERGEYALLRAASGAGAEQMLEQRYRLKISEIGTLGSTLHSGETYVSSDLHKVITPGHSQFLPEAVSEIFLPLKVSNLTVGALDIHSNKLVNFHGSDTRTLKLLADQLGAAIENAQLVQQVEGTVSELNKAYRSQTQTAWQSTLDQRSSSSYEYDGKQIRSIPDNLPEELMKQLENGKAVVTPQNPEYDHESEETKNTLLIPLMVLNQLIGVIGLEQDDPAHVWTNEEITVAQAAANRAALTLENARLLEESQRRALKERTISEATARIGTTLNVENILQSTIEELERVLGNSEMILQINTGTLTSADESIDFQRKEQQ